MPYKRAGMGRGLLGCQYGSNKSSLFVCAFDNISCFNNGRCSWQLIADVKYIMKFGKGTVHGKNLFRRGIVCKVINTCLGSDIMK